MQDLVTLGEDACRRFADRPLFGEKDGGEWRWTSYGALQQQIDEVRGGLAALGIGRGDVVAIVSPNRVAWAVAAYATFGLGAVFVPLYAEQQPDEWRYILADCGARLVFAGSPSIAAQLATMRTALPAVEHVILIDGDGPYTFESLRSAGRARPIAAIHPSGGDTATFIYTSGTTGRPKGVVLGHRNLVSNVEATSAAFPIRADDRSLSFLPWAHVYGQVAELYFLMHAGASTAINDALPHLTANLLEVRPTILVAVPRVFHRIHAGVQAQLARRPRFVQRLFRAGVRHAVRRSRGEHLGVVARVTRWLADRLVFAKIRARFGGRLRFAVSGSAALSREAAEMIEAIGIPVYEGYGLTETSPIVTMNRPDLHRLGSVGRVIEGVRVEIDRSMGSSAGDGEIIVYGENVMQGYHGLPAETARAFTADGGFRTGDLGRLDDDGFLYITGRIKEQYKLENGKYVMPSVLEQALSLSPFFRAVLVYGANRPYNVALVVIDPDAVHRWAGEHHVDLMPDLSVDPHVEKLIAHELEAYAEGFRSFERPRGFLLITRDFSIDDGTLTPSQKLKRNVIIERYRESIEALYVQVPPPSDETLSSGTTAPSPGHLTRSADRTR
jgi:long-chain acyl-CoA synthetase